MTSLQRVTAFSLILIAVLATQVQSITNQFKIIRVIDGDTIKAVIGKEQTIVRLVGIDAPEKSRGKRQPGQPYSQAATKHLTDMVLNRTVTIQDYGPDRYGRTLGIIFVNGMNVNLEIIRAGLAEVYRGGKPAPGLNLEPFWQAEEEARKASRGMWSLGDKYISPRDWRKKNKN